LCATGKREVQRRHLRQFHASCGGEQTWAVARESFKRFINDGKRLSGLIPLRADWRVARIY